MTDAPVPAFPMDQYDALFAENLDLLLKLRAQHTTVDTAWRTVSVPR